MKMNTPTAIFLGLALIAGAIYNKASISCSTESQCAVLFNGEVTFINKQSPSIIEVVDIETRTIQLRGLKDLEEVDKPK